MKRETILLVDDEKEIVDLLGVYLSNDGYSVCKCYNGTDAMKCIENSDIDLAILDIMLPDIDRFRLCQKSGKSFSSPLLCSLQRLRTAIRLWDLRLAQTII